MPQSYCAEWGRIDDSSLFGWSFLVILGHSSNDNDNDNQFKLCSSHACSFGRSVRKFWTCSKIYVPSTNTFHLWLCSLKTCSYLVCRTAYMLYSGQSYCIPGCSNCIVISYMSTHAPLWVPMLRHSYMTVRQRQTRIQCEIRRMQLECARDCCKVDIRVHIRVHSPLSYTCWFLHILTSFLLNSVHSCSFVWNTR